jgi:serine/threonine protein kinase
MWNVRIARRKVRAFEQCQHPAVVPFVDVGTAGSMHYLAWPMVEGTPLDKYVEQHGKLSAQETARIALQTAEGLAAANAAGLFHGMLKPSNLMLTDDLQVRILDFGIGCLLSETEGESLVDTMSTANSVNSGLDCASPESIMDPSNLSAVGDQYSLGCVMYFCMTGQYPFPDGTAVEKMMAHQTKQPTPIRDINPEVPEDMVAVVERLMQKNPGHRYGDFKEVIEALRPLAQPASAGTGRVTMQMPRIKLSRPIVAEPPSGAPAEPIRPSAMQRPVPPLVRPTSNSNSSPPVRPPSPSGQGGIRPTSPSARGLPQPPARVPSPPVRVTRPPVVEPPLPDSQAEELPQPQVRSYRHPQSPYAPEPAAAQVNYPPQREGFGLVTVILLALLAGVGAFFLAKLIPF